MEVIRGKGLSIANGRSLEQGGKLQEAADIYQQMVDRDPLNQEALSRLLLVYRKLKAYKKELDAIDTALDGYQQKDQSKQAAWLKAHPKAAGASRAILKKLGGASATAFGINPTVARLLKRKELVERKVSGGKGRKAAKKKVTPKKKAVSPKSKAPHPLKAIVNKGKAKEQKRAESAERKRAAAAERKEKAEQQRLERQRRKEEAAAARKEAAEKRKAEREAEKHLSLFVISLRYLVTLQKIDNLMEEHVAFLNKHYKTGTILVSGRQVPRTGGVIIARGKNRDAIEKLVKQDPFVKRKYASYDIVEFSASRSVDALSRWLKS